MVRATAAAYRDGSGRGYTLIVAPYADAAAAGRAFANLRRNLDPYHKVIDKAGNVYDIKVGSGDEAAITAKIRKLLAEK